MSPRKFSRQEVLDVIEREWVPFREQTSWTCIRCGKCCRTSWRINLTWKELKMLEKNGRIPAMPEILIELDPVTGADHPYFFIEKECPMLIDGNICSAYPDWPYTCATYPFLLMPDGKLLVHIDCQGFGKGKKRSREEMVEIILNERARAGMYRPDNMPDRS